MNDRFKFRTFWKDEGRMYYFNGDFPRISKEDEEIAVIMQCTGLRDKHGKLVYEKDILLSPDYDEPYMVIVEWDNEKGYIVKAWNGKEFEYTLSDDTLESLKYFQIIGNEFENPELLDKI